MCIRPVKIRTQLNPFRSTGAAIATSKVIISQTSPTECAKESVKISSDAKGSNAFFDVCCAYVRCHCGLFFRKKKVFRIVTQIPGFYSSNYGVEMKHLGNNVSIKICQS